jgi:FKBP-type peptidyl-prolyl cis-trans isomerase FklB
MNTRAILLTVTSLTLVVSAATAATPTAAPADAPKTFKDDKEKANYAIGLNVGMNFKQGNLEYDAAAFNRGMEDTLTGKQGLTQQEAMAAIRKYQQERIALVGEKNKKEGEAFLADNKAKPGVITLPSRLQYKVLTDGTGDIPKPEDSVTVNYVGKLIDGTEFDSSVKRGQPATFRVGGVIPGWTEALTKMKVGSKWQLFIPSDLAYKEMGKPPQIGPNATLLFEVELLSNTPPAAVAAPAAAPLTSDIIKVPSLEEMKKGAKIETIKAEEVEKLQKLQAQPAPPEKKK